MAKTKSAIPDKSNQRKKKAKHLLSAPEAASRKSIGAPKPNPFESIWSRKKFDVIGKKRKGEEKRVGRSRSLAVVKRSKTLLKDYEESRKSSKFIDRRIGESNDDLGEFQKSILRLQKERQLKMKREKKYNLSDGEEDNVDLPDHFSGRDDFEDEVPLEDDEQKIIGAEDDGYLNLHKMLNPSEASPSENENVNKTKKQVYEEIIAKSKFHKALKAKDKEDDEQFMNQLDKEFASLAQSEALLSLTQPNKMIALKALLNKGCTTQPIKGELPGSETSEIAKWEKPDAYDLLVKEMVLDIRARPSDRVKSSEEIAQEERERLELLEEERQKRMLATEVSDNESDDDTEHQQISFPKKVAHISGDDYGGSFSDEERHDDQPVGVDNITEKKNSSEDENESYASSDASENTTSDSDSADNGGGDYEHEGDAFGNDCSKLLPGKDWEQSDEDTANDEDKIMEVRRTKDTVNGAKTKYDENKKKSENTNILYPSKVKSLEKLGLVNDNPLPFIIEVPDSLAELCLLLNNRPDSEAIEAINRIRACNAIRLSPGKNRKKMQAFYGILLQYFAVLATKRPLPISRINILVKPLVEMSTETPYFAAICARERLAHIRAQFCQDVKNPEKSSWPSLKTLHLFRLWCLIFPCSDFRHVITTPTTFLMCEYLMRCPIMSGRDIAVGSFLCSMILYVAKLSRKFFPEAIVFLQLLLFVATNMKQGPQCASQFHYLLDLETLKPWLMLRNQVSDVYPIDFFKVMTFAPDSGFFDTDCFRVSILSSVVETLRGFIGIYIGLSSFSEIFEPIVDLLYEVVKQNDIPDSLRGNLEDIAHLAKKKLEEHQQLRQPLQMRKKKPTPLKLLNPKFEENYMKGRDYDPDRERVERKKMKKLIKREAKGAARELRKDNYFLHEVKERGKLLEEEERAEKYGKARAFLQEQEHAFKSGQLGKGRKRKS